VPAGANNSAPMTTIQIKVCSNSFAIMRCFPLLCGQHHDRAVFRQTCDVYSAVVVAGLDPAIHLFHKECSAKMDGYAGQARVWRF
jgi:hypothetical protein